ncbi:MAG: MucB/RseB C-terminal domain-containing protein [Pseudomonadales bacterium]|nr:MucB/RseB C-terminal domain-containing protein [Pseudomonadales bacterium]
MAFASMAFASILGIPALSAEEVAAGKSVTITPQVLLKKMTGAFKDLNYEGRFFYLNGNDVRSVRILHGVFDGVEKERLIHLDGPPSEIIRNGKDVVCLHDGEMVDRFERKLPARIFSQGMMGQALLDLYDARLAGDDRIAGRKAQRLRLIPKDENRYGYILWLDKESGLVLKSVLLNQENKPLEIFQYTELQVGLTLDLEEFQQVGNSPHSLGLKKGRAGNDPPLEWQVNWLPSGYKQSNVKIRRISSAQVDIQTLMYSDGLNAFTLFFEPNESIESLPPVTRKGPTVAISRKIDEGGDSVLVTIVGELPEVAAQHILNSIQRTTKEASHD